MNDELEESHSLKFEWLLVFYPNILKMSPEIPGIVGGTALQNSSSFVIVLCAERELNSVNTFYGGKTHFSY